MRFRSTLSLGCLAMLCACGGSDGTPILDGGPDTTTGGDANGGMDGNGMQDTGGGDTGMGNDGSMNDGGGFNVAAIPCVVLWLDAAKGVTQTNNVVSAWADQTSNANNATQGIMARQPSFVASVINNLPAIHFAKGQAGTGNMLTLVDKASLQFGHQDFGVWVVGRFDNNPADGMATGVGVLFSKQSGSNNNAGPYLWANDDIGNPAAGLKGAVDGNNIVGATSSYNDNKARSYAIRRTGNTIELRVNGSQVAMITQNGAVDVSAVGTQARIGADGDASTHRLNGDIAEVVACKGMMAGPDLTALDGYLKNKYNL